jgi:hypothetical protein
VAFDGADVDGVRFSTDDGVRKMRRWGPSEPGSGDGPAGGFVVQAQDGQSGEVDDAGSGQDVGQDAFLAAATGFSAAPGSVGVPVVVLVLCDAKSRV